MNEANAKIINRLKDKYKNDADALEEIERRAKDIEYVEGRERSGDYTGQSSESMAKMLEDSLNDWY